MRAANKTSELAMSMARPSLRAAPCSAVFDNETVEAALRRTEATACAMKEPDCSDVLAAEVRKLRRELTECREKNLWLVDESLRIKRQIPETSEMLELPNDTKIRFCNAFGEILAHCILCKECDLYLRWGDGDLCSTGKAVIALEMCYTDTSIVFPPNAQAEPPEERR
jgi:hypothetical protein